ncbi:MAG: peptidoglycan DD-metalloendopeptidase family protein [Clostridia bacterium]|nr:peptidoglycan DD-metalloendopeptidase family protein [Clostridia bacterium]
MNNKKLSTVLKRMTGALLLCGMLLLSVPENTSPVYAAGVTSADVSRIEAELDAAERERQKYENLLYTARKGASNALEEKNYFDSLVTATEKKITAAEELIAQYTKEIGEKELEIAGKQTEYEESYESFRQRLRLSYEEGYVSYLEILLSAETFTDFLVSMERVSDVLERESSLMDKLEKEEQELNRELAELNTLKAEQDATYATLNEDKAKYEGLSAERENQVASYQSDASKYQTLYNEAKAAEQELDKELEKTLAELAKKSAASYVGGEFNWPVDLSIKYISSGYGWRTLWGSRDFHLGIDIPAANGSNIYAANSGTVVTATYHKSYGYYVVIDHGGGKATLYAHSSKLLVSAGDKVTQGDVIAKVGTTGSSSGYHLHFEIRINGTTTDPLKYADFATPAGLVVAK